MDNLYCDKINPERTNETECPVEVQRRNLRISLGETKRRTSLMPDGLARQYFPCHACRVWLETAKSDLDERQKSIDKLAAKRSLIKLLDKFNYNETKAVVDSKEKKGTKFHQKRNAKKLERMGMLHVTMRLRPSPRNKNKLERTLTARDTLYAVTLFPSKREQAGITEEPEEIRGKEGLELLELYQNELKKETQQLEREITERNRNGAPVSIIFREAAKVQKKELNLLKEWTERIYSNIKTVSKKPECEFRPVGRCAHDEQLTKI